MNAPITSDGLLSVAEALARFDDTSTAADRRAVSTAYYALFHGLVSDAVRRTTEDDPDRDDDRRTYSRWYAHGEIRTVSQWVVRLARGETVPNGVPVLLGSPPTDLVDLARTFVQLQEARHEADYDHSADLDEADAQAAIDAARDALSRLPRLAGSHAYANYLVLLLGGPRVVGR